MAQKTLMDQLKLPDNIKKILGNARNIILGVVALIIIFNSFFQVEPEEVGVITRFGKFDRTVDPGLGYKIPLIESVKMVRVERQQKLEFGFKTQQVGINSSYKRNAEDRRIAQMLTGDLNLADVEWVVQYRIDDPYKYLFKVRNTESTLRDISESAMRQIVGDRTVNEVLTYGRSEIETQLELLIQKICRDYQIGVKIDQVVMQDVNPPEPVKAAFNAVNEAQQEEQTLINKAKSEYNKVIPKARGQAEETIQKAEGYATERVNNAKGETARFTDLYNEYIKAPQVTKTRIYLETMSEVIPKLGNKIITDDKGNNVLPLLQMQLEKNQ